MLQLGGSPGLILEALLVLAVQRGGERSTLTAARRPSDSCSAS